MQFERAWDAMMVAEALVRAYRLLDGAPVMSRGDSFVVDDKRVDPRSLAAWIGMRRYITEARDIKILRVWASCVARRESVRDLYAQLHWKRSTTERRRAAALEKIARGLNSEGV